MEAKNVIMVIVLCLVMLAVGGVAGYVFHQPVVAPGEPGAPAAVVDAQATAVFGSKVVPNTTAQGMVTKIDGRNITLTRETDSITISMAPDAGLFSFIPADKGSPTAVARKITFADVKIGDNGTITFSISGTGQVIGSSLLINPPEASQAIPSPSAPSASAKPTVSPKK